MESAVRMPAESLLPCHEMGQWLQWEFKRTVMKKQKQTGEKGYSDWDVCWHSIQQEADIMVLRIRGSDCVLLIVVLPSYRVFFHTIDTRVATNVSR
jgi:hypothetical protein